jgi:hypothetical protein
VHREPAPHRRIDGLAEDLEPLLALAGLRRMQHVPEPTHVLQSDPRVGLDLGGREP